MKHLLKHLSFEHAAAYSLLRTVPRNKLLLSIYAKDGVSVLRLMGPEGFRMELMRWDYGKNPRDPAVTYNYRLSSRYIRKQITIPDTPERRFLPYNMSPKTLALIQLLVNQDDL